MSICLHTRTRDMDRPKRWPGWHLLDVWLPFAVVTPDGVWHQQAAMGWFGSTSNDKETDVWRAEVLGLYAAHPDAVAAAVDCHI